MARFSTHAVVVTPDHPLMKAYQAGFKETPPGRVLRELLEDTRGAYEITLVIPPHTLERLRQVAELTSDRQLLEISRHPEIRISFEHLRGTDPEARIDVGGELAYEDGEAERLGLSHPPDPKTSFVVENDE
jgi:hypothetical protein